MVLIRTCLYHDCQLMMSLLLSGGRIREVTVVGSDGMVQNKGFCNLRFFDTLIDIIDGPVLRNCQFHTY